MWTFDAEGVCNAFPSSIFQDLAKRFSLFLGMDLVRVRYQVVALHRCANTHIRTHSLTLGIYIVQLDSYNADTLQSEESVLIIGCPHFKGAPIMSILCTYMQCCDNAEFQKQKLPKTVCFKFCFWYWWSKASLCRALNRLRRTPNLPVRQCQAVHSLFSSLYIPENRLRNECEHALFCLLEARVYMLCLE